MNILVIGCDQVGASLIRDLERIGHDISLIEKDPEQLKRLDAFDDYSFGGTALVGGTQPPRRSLLQQGLACFGRAAHAEAAQLRPAGDSGEKCACVYLYGIGLGQAAVLLEGKDLVGQRHGAAQFSAVGVHGLPPSSAVREDALE